MAKTYCIFSAQYLPHLGGIERYTSYLAKGLMAQGDQVLIVTANPGGLPSYERMDGIPVLRFPSYPLIDGRFPVPKPNREFLRLHRKLKNLRSNVTLINARFYFHSLYGVLYGRSHHSRTIILDHGSSHLHLDSPLLNKLGQWFEHGITALEKCFCKEFYGVSQASVKWLQHFHIQAKGTLPNAVDLPAIEERLAHPQVDFRKKYEIPADAMVLAYTGRLLPEKGLLPLRDAFSLLSEKRKDVYLLLAGDGPLSEELQKTCLPRMILTGRLDAGEVTDLLAASDMFCLPSVSEGLSTSLLEAAACRTHILVTRSACPFELLPDTSYASIIEEADPACICQAILAAVEDPGYRERSIQKTYENLAGHFTWDRIPAQLTTYMEQPAPKGKNT